MLQSMRHLAQSWVFKGLMLILVVSFGIWGIGDTFRGNPLQRTVAKVGKVAITVQQLNAEFEQTLLRARQSLGPDLTEQQAKQLGLLGTSLNALTEREGLDQDLRRLGIDVNNKTVLAHLATLPQMQGKDGQLNTTLLRQFMGLQHLSEATFFHEEREDLARHQLLDVLLTETKVPDAIVDAVYRARGQKRILDVITLKNDSITDLPAPDDKTLQDFYQANPKLFTAPEYRAVTIAKLSTDDIAKDVVINDDQLKKEYELKSPEMAQPERRDVLQVVLQDETKAKQLAAVAKSSGKLASSAKQMGYDTVPLNGTEEKSLLPELAKPVFALEVNQISDPIKSNLGWHVLQLKKITPAGVPAFDDVKEQLRESMKRDQAVDAAAKMANQLDDELAAGHALEDIADSMKMRLIKIPAIDASGKAPDGKEPAELPSKDDVLKAAFSQNAGETSPVMDDKNGNSIVVRTDGVTPSGVKPFDSVKDDVLTAWKAQEQAKQAGTEAEGIAKGLREGKLAASFAAQKGIDVRVSKPISQLGDTDPSLPSNLTPEILKMKKGDVTSLPLPDHQLILRLSDIIDVDPKVDDGVKGRVATELSSQMPKERTEEYLKYLRVLFPVDVKQDVLETLNQQGGS